MELRSYEVLNSLFSISAESVAECLVCGIANPVLAVLVDRPKAYRVAGVCHVTLAHACLFLVRNLFHVTLDDIAVVVGQLLSLCCGYFVCCNIETLSKIVKESVQFSHVVCLRCCVLAIYEIQFGIDTVDLSTLCIPDVNPVFEALHFLGVVESRLSIFLVSSSPDSLTKNLSRDGSPSYLS